VSTVGPDVVAVPGRQATGAQVWTALWIVYVVWGSTYLAIAITIESMPPLLALGTRFLAAAALMSGYLVLRHGPAILRVSWPEVRGAAIVGVLLLGVGIGLLTLAERYVPTGVAALIVAVVPLWIAVIRTVTGDRPRAVTFVGVAVGLVGVALLVLPGGHVVPVGGATEAQRVGWSLAIMVGSACWALGSYLQPRLRTPDHPLVLTTYEMVAGGLALCLVGLLRGEQARDLVDATSRSWWAWLYLILMGSLVGYTAFVWVLGHAPLSLVATYAYVNPVVAVALGWAFRDEPLTAGVLVGGAIVVAGVVLVVSGERPGRKPVPP
jgi:drug/metabolite transporter (DMT)-like permease